MSDTTFTTQAVRTRHWYWKISLPFLYAKLSLVTWSSMELSAERKLETALQKRRHEAQAPQHHYTLSPSGGRGRVRQLFSGSTWCSLWPPSCPCSRHHPNWEMLAWETCHSLDSIQMSQHTGEKDKLQRQGDFWRSWPEENRHKVNTQVFWILTQDPVLFPAVPLLP